MVVVIQAEILKHVQAAQAGLVVQPAEEPTQAAKPVDPVVYDLPVDIAIEASTSTSTSSAEAQSQNPVNLRQLEISPAASPVAAHDRALPPHTGAGAKPEANRRVTLHKQQSGREKVQQSAAPACTIVVVHPDPDGADVAPAG